jgi:hypothetical protein
MNSQASYSSILVPIFKQIFDKAIDRTISRDTVLDMFTALWKKPKNISDEKATELYTKCARATLNLQVALSTFEPLAWAIPIDSIGIKCVVDLIARQEEHTFLGIFGYQETIDCDLTNRLPYIMQAVARGYNSSNDEKIDTIIYMSLMTGQNGYYTYDPNDPIEVIAQMINQGYAPKKHGPWCKKCSHFEKCSFFI